MSRAQPWPVDAQGRLAPLIPTRGLAIQRSGVGLCYFHWRVTHCNRREFEARNGRHHVRRPLAEWGDFLDSLFDEPGVVLSFHLPSCPLARRGWCSGCDASGLGRTPSGAAPVAPPVPSPAVPRPHPGASTMPAPSPARDVRILRAAREVLKSYTITRTAPTALSVTGGTRPYTVTVDPGWSRTPACTCPDHARPGAPWCKHIIAALLQEDDLRCQLLELFLA